MFFTLMVGAPGSLALAPPRGAHRRRFYVDGGRSRISISTTQGARRRRFLALMVLAPVSPAPAPPGGPPSTFFTLMVGAAESPSPPPRGSAVDFS
jgi:hypothetical protein